MAAAATCLGFYRLFLTISDMYTTAHGRPHQHRNIVIGLIAGAALFVSLGLRGGDFLQVFCGILGAFATIARVIDIPASCFLSPALQAC
jgi:hypothetical protein